MNDNRLQPTDARLQRQSITGRRIQKIAEYKRQLNIESTVYRYGIMNRWIGEIGRGTGVEEYTARRIRSTGVYSIEV